ncbi:MAG: M50 family metallopeptidase [Anaerolineae bacterium]|nr:M50 family metallopeptidase [Anaerolineae bacterium]
MNTIDSKKQTPAWPAIALVVVTLIFCLLVYTFAHEGGHALAVALFGGTLTGFNINFLDFSAHVHYSGDFSRAQQAVISAAGVSLPLLLWTLLALVSFRRGSAALGLVKIAITMITINTLLAWIILPLVALGGQVVSDDSTRFLSITAVPPVLLSLAAVLVYLGGWALLVASLGGWRGLVAYRQTLTTLTMAQARGALIAMLVIGGLVGAAAAGISLAAGNAAVSAPDGYSQTAQLDLGARAYDREAVYTFTLERPASASLYMVLLDVRSGPLRITLVGPDGAEQTFLSVDSPDFATGQSTVNPTGLALESGEYQLLVTAPGSGGTLTVFARIEP